LKIFLILFAVAHAAGAKIGPLLPTAKHTQQRTDRETIESSENLISARIHFLCGTFSAGQTFVQLKAIRFGSGPQNLQLLKS
jgi:hypothetical protein